MTPERILLTIITLASLYMLATVLAGRWVRRGSKRQTTRITER